MIWLPFASIPWHTKRAWYTIVSPNCYEHAPLESSLQPVANSIPVNEDPLILKMFDEHDLQSSRYTHEERLDTMSLARYPTFAFLFTENLGSGDTFSAWDISLAQDPASRSLAFLICWTDQGFTEIRLLFFGFLGLDFGSEKLGPKRCVKVVSNKENSHKELCLLVCFNDTIRHGSVHEKVVKGGRRQGGRHVILQSRRLNGFETLVKGQKGATASSNTSAEDRSKHGDFKVRRRNSFSGQVRHFAHDKGAHGFVKNNGDCLEYGRET